MTRYSQGANAWFPAMQRALREYLDREELLALRLKRRREGRVRGEGKGEWCWAIPVQILFPDHGNCENDEND